MKTALFFLKAPLYQSSSSAFEYYKYKIIITVDFVSAYNNNNNNKNMSKYLNILKNSIKGLACSFGWMDDVMF